MSLQEVSGVSNNQRYDPLPRFLDQIKKEEKARFGYRISKRVVDFTVALILLILLVPLMLIISILIKCTSKGPVFFTQERVGRGGKSFTFIKFRSMRHKADDSIHREYMNKLIQGEAESQADDGEEPLFKMKHDPRITEIGHFLRKTSLDEIPQLLNVLSGSMSLVGPRPPIPYEVNAYKSWHMQRLSVKPGITGLWQVSGRSTTTFDQMVNLDLEYIEKRSLPLDLKILFNTIPAALDLKTAA